MVFDRDGAQNRAQFFSWESNSFGWSRPRISHPPTPRRTRQSTRSEPKKFEVGGRRRSVVEMLAQQFGVPGNRLSRSFQWESRFPDFVKESSITDPQTLRRKAAMPRIGLE